MKKLLITGSKGLAGSSLLRMQDQYPQYEFITADRSFADLTKEEDVSELFAKVRPTHVIHTAAAVGGIGGNAKSHGRFFRDNILMNTHVIHYAMITNVQKLIAFSSVCAYPDDLRVLQEDKMHLGPVYPSNQYYGYAKRMVDVQIRAYKAQYGIKNYCSVTMGNVAGKFDNFNIESGHVIPVLMHKLYLAKQDNTDFKIWGDGQSLREFLSIDDAAKCCLGLLDLDEVPERIIVSGEKEVSIKEMVDLLIKVADFPADRVVYETDKPNGQRSRPSDKTIFNQYFPNFQYTPAEVWLKDMWLWFCENYEVARK